MDYAIILLSAYPNLDNVIKVEGENYLRRCLNSAYFMAPTEKVACSILSVYETKEKLIVLKNKLDLLFSRLDDEEKALIFLKYAGVQPKEKFKFSSRTYFRKQIKLLEKVKEYLGYLNLTEDVFIREYADIPYFKTLSQTLPDVMRRRNERALKTAFEGGR